MMKRNDELEGKLATPDQQAMREVVRALPDETVSLAWRSALNEEILRMAPPIRRRDRFAWLMRPALGLACAGALAVAMLMHNPIASRTVQPANSGLEAALLDAHDQATGFADVTGGGLSVTEVSYGASHKPARTLEWSESDVESL